MEGLPDRRHCCHELLRSWRAVDLGLGEFDPAYGEICGIRARSAVRTGRCRWMERGAAHHGCLCTAWNFGRAVLHGDPRPVLHHIARADPKTLWRARRTRRTNGRELELAGSPAIRVCTRHS